MRPRKIKFSNKIREKLLIRKKEAQIDGEYRVATRIHAVILNNDCKTSGEIARILVAPLSKVSEWLRNYELHGYEALLEGHRSGRPSELEEKQYIKLYDIIDSGPIAYGYLSGVWTSTMITRIIEEEFEIKYHPGHVRKILHKLGFSVQRPKRIFGDDDDEKLRKLRNKWRRYTYPNIKKKPKK